jgi:hypothetical protein
MLDNYHLLNFPDGSKINASPRPFNRHGDNRLRKLCGEGPFSLLTVVSFVYSP